MHSVKVEAHRRFVAPPKAELKVGLHVFLNVGHQRGSKVVTSGTSVKINVFFFRRFYDLYLFIAARPREGDILCYYETRHGVEIDVFGRQLSVQHIFVECCLSLLLLVT